MNSRKTVIRFFTIADYEEEEVWLHNQQKNGWKLLRMIPPCFYIFAKCAPEDVAYRLDYKNNAESSDYFQIFSDYGWEYIGRCLGWLYFRKPLSETDCEQDSEIFSDNESRIDMINHVVKTRLLPCLIIFLCCVLPNPRITLSHRLLGERTKSSCPVFLCVANRHVKANFEKCDGCSFYFAKIQMKNKLYLRKRVSHEVFPIKQISFRVSVI